MDEKEFFEVSEEDTGYEEYEEYEDYDDTEEMMRGFDENEDEINPLAYLDALINALDKLINSSTRIPGGNLFVKKADLELIVKQMRRSAPSALQYGMDLKKEHTRILGSAANEAERKAAEAELKAQKALDKAKKSAESMIFEADTRAKNIIADAQRRADAMVQNEEIHKRAVAEAKSILATAQVDAKETRLAASSTAYNLLTDSQKQLEGIIRHLSELREDVTKDME